MEKYKFRLIDRLILTLRISFLRRVIYGLNDIHELRLICIFIYIEKLEKEQRMMLYQEN